MVSKVRSLGLQGIGGYEVGVECFLSGGLPGFVEQKQLDELHIAVTAKEEE